MNENMEQRRKVRQINVAREVLESFGYEVIDPDEKEEGPEAPGPKKTGALPEYRENIRDEYEPNMRDVGDYLSSAINHLRLMQRETYKPGAHTPTELRNVIDQLDAARSHLIQQRIIP